MNNQAVPVRPSDRDLESLVDHLMGLNRTQLRSVFKRTRVAPGFSVAASEYLDRVRSMAAKDGCEFFSCHHMFICAVEENNGLLSYCLRVAGLDPELVAKNVREQIASKATRTPTRARRVYPSITAKEILATAYDEMSERDGKKDITMSHITLALLQPHNGPHLGLLAIIKLDVPLAYDVALRTSGYLTAREEKILAVAEEVLAQISIPRTGKIPQEIKTPMPDAITAEVKWPAEFSAIFIACARENKGNVTVDLLQRMLDRLERKRTVADANTPSTSE